MSRRMCFCWKLLMLQGMMRNSLISLLLLVAFLESSSQADNVAAIAFCAQEADSHQLEQKLSSSDIVFAGYTRSVHSLQAEFLVFNVFKGEDKIAGLFKNRKLSALESALNRRLVNVTGFPTRTPQSECQNKIRVGETYLLFAKFAGRLLLLDGTDAIQTYSKSKEEDVKRIIASTAKTIDKWSDWSACNKSCGGGIQLRRRLCASDSQEKQECGGIESSEQQRSCNTFPCMGLTDVLEVVGLKRTLLHPEDRPSAYRLISKRSWSSTAALPGGFPSQFSLMIAIRASKAPVSGFLFRVLQDERDIQLAVHLNEDTTSLVLPGGLYVRFKQDSKLQDGKWYWMSFSVRRNTVTFFLDCKPSGVLPATIKADNAQVMDTKLAKYVVGSLNSRDRSAFQGDVEQILFSEAPSAAAEQCSVIAQPVVTTSSDNLRPPNGNAIKKSMNAISSALSTKQDDEDFAFNNDEDGSGSFYDDEYDDVDQEDRQPPDIKKAVLLLSESPAKDDEEDNTENNDLSNFLYDKKLSGRGDVQEDYDDDDYDDEEEEDEVETGSGSSPPPTVPEWTNWSECSQTCDWGVRTRTKACVTANDNGHCSSQVQLQKQSEPCFRVACPQTTPSTERPSTTAKPHERIKQDSPYNWKNPWTKMRGLRPEVVPRTSSSPMHLLHLRYQKNTHSASCRPSCQNGGFCNTFGKCVCKKGFLGRYCEKAACKGICENGGTCAQHGRCLCLPGFYGIRCEFKKCTKFVAVKRPYEKSFKKKIVKEEKFPCGAWDWKKCTRTKVYYAPVFQTFYRTEYICDSENSVISID